MSYRTLAAAAGKIVQMMEWPKYGIDEPALLLVYDAPNLKVYALRGAFMVVVPAAKLPVARMTRDLAGGAVEVEDETEFPNGWVAVTYTRGPNWRMYTDYERVAKIATLLSALAR